MFQLSAVFSNESSAQGSRGMQNQFDLATGLVIGGSSHRECTVHLFEGRFLSWVEV